MANPTTYFGWVMPNSADLVTDLPADFNVFGQGVDTSMQYLLGGTTGQILSKTSGTNMAFTWINNDQGDITGVTAGTGITGGGTSGAVTITNDMATTITTAGDLIKGTGSGTYNRLGIGSTGQVLTVASGAPSWATPASGGGLTLLSTTSLTGASTTISSISGSYKNLQIILKNTDNSGDDTVFFQLNGDTGANYYYAGFRIVGGVQTLYNQVATTKVHTIYGDGTTAVRAGQAVINLYRYTDTDVVFFNVNSYDGYSGASDTIMANGIYDNTAAITSITIIANSGTFSGGTAYIYGVN